MPGDSIKKNFFRLEFQNINHEWRCTKADVGESLSRDDLITK